MSTQRNFWLVESFVTEDSDDGEVLIKKIWGSIVKHQNENFSQTTFLTFHLSFSLILIKNYKFICFSCHRHLKHRNLNYANFKFISSRFSTNKLNLWAFKFTAHSRNISQFLKLPTLRKEKKNFSLNEMCHNFHSESKRKFLVETMWSILILEAS